MKTRCCLLLPLLAACSHDVERLEPSRSQIVRWGDTLGEGCGGCLDAMCVEEAEACILDRDCHQALLDCQPRNPSCREGSALRRLLSDCSSDRCNGVCTPRDTRLDCLGKFEFRKQAVWGDVPVTIEATSFDGMPLAEQLDFSVCHGAPLSCDEESAETGELNQVVTLYLRWGSSPWRPYIRFASPQIVTFYVVDDVTVLEEHRFTGAAITREQYAWMHLLVGTSVDPARGTLSATIYDCQGTPLEDVSYELSRDGAESVADAVPYYFDETNIKPVSQLAHTTSRGMGGFAGLRPGGYDLIARQGDQIVARIEDLRVEADAITQVALTPLTKQEALDD